MAYRAAVLTRMAQKWVTEVRILHPPLRRQKRIRCCRLFENLVSDLVAIAQRNERPVVNRKVVGSTPIGGVTWI